MARDDLRVGDAERDEVASALHEHFAQGRLTREELDERLSTALSAKTVGDLREVTRDLPGSRDALAHPSGPGLPGPDGPWRGGPPWAGPPWAGPHWGGPPWARRTGRMAHRGRHPRFGPPAGVFLIALVVIATATHGWFVFPLFAFVWFTTAFVGIRHARRWHRLTR